MVRLLFLCIILSAVAGHSFAQKLDSARVMTKDQITSEDTIPVTVPMIVLSGDTLPVVEMNPIMIYPPYEFKNKRQHRRYTRLVYNIQVAYPYAKLAAKKLKEFEKALDTIASKKAQRKFARQAEKELEDEFGDELKKLTFSQGKILIKLIDRETGNSSYEIVQELRGKFTAFIWQTLARLFGYNLKQQYDPEGKDKEIEEIIHLIDEGYF
jgi:hypothetical protein